MTDLSIVIPARNEEFLKLTVEDLLKNKRGNTEIVVGLDGYWPDPPLTPHPDLKIIHYDEAIGQRALTNRCVDQASGNYVMKVDAHCAFDEGFDVKMVEAFKETGDNVVMAPYMKNLHVFDWKCYKCGMKVYQDKENICPPNARHSEPVQMRKKIIWQPRRGTGQSSYCFDSEPHFQYFGAYKEKQVGDIVESMSLQGSAFMCTKEKYNELNICDESFGSWGSQGIEVACKFWLSGGRVLINKRTWYAHLFRTKSNFGFPYPISGNQVSHAKALARDLFFNNKWPKAIHPLSWLVEKFNPPGWSEEDLKRIKQT